MKLRRSVWLSTATLLLLVVIAGCNRRIPPPAPPPPAPPPPAATPAPPPPPPPPPAPAPAPPPKPLTEDEIFQRKTLAELNAEMPLADVFFDFDESTIKDDQRAVLQKNMDWLRRWTSVRITVEGHTDSRGTNEYNLSLGERRAAAVKDYLAGLGLAADRVLVISKGEETPVCAENVEGCWSRNRRAHFVVTAK